MKTYIVIVKQELKDLAVMIRKAKADFKAAQRDRKCSYTIRMGQLMILNSLKRTYRHRHIAYCLFRGKTIEQIEKPRKDNRPDMSAVNVYLMELESAAAAAFNAATNVEAKEIS